MVGGGASAEAVDGLTNRDLYDRFGFAVKGRPVPDSAVEDDRVTAGWLGAEATAERSVWLEAEAGTFGSPWTREPSESASGGAYLTTEGVESADEPPSEGHLVHEFSVPESEYHVFGRGRAPAGDSDSFWLRVDDGDWIHWDGAGGSGNPWRARMGSGVSHSTANTPSPSRSARTTRNWTGWW